MSYFWVIVLTTVGFCTLAAILLVPIYRFLRREEEASRAWTPERLGTKPPAPPNPPPPPGPNGQERVTNDE